VTSPLRILLLEDSPSDAELIRDILENANFNFEITRIQTRDEFLAALRSTGTDLILADYRLPAFDGLSALTLALAARPELPFIFVSGTLGEEVAIEAIKIGATDYVLKTRLSRLVPAVHRALREARERERLRRLEAELAHKNRVSMLGELSASIAHELKQPLAAIVMSGDASLRWLAMQPPDVEEAGRSVERMIRDAHRAADIIDRLRNLTRKSASRKEVLDLGEAILEVNALARGEAVKNGVTLRTQLAPRLPSIQGDRIELQQVMLNLIVNAIQAMRGVADDRRELVISAEDAGAEGVRIGVRDTGPGLSPESVPRLFEPFYTTKPYGMGMGLSICRSIIEAHGGRLWATGCEPQGALFQFTLPAN
jgi:signal transduction histidine kinase